MKHYIKILVAFDISLSSLEFQFFYFSRFLGQILVTNLDLVLGFLTECFLIDDAECSPVSHDELADLFNFYSLGSAWASGSRYA